MSRGAGEQQLDELYNQLLNSFDSDGPDLNLTPPASANPSRSPSTDPRQNVTRKQTADSEKLLNLYQSYAVDDTQQQHDAQYSHHYRGAHTPSPTPPAMAASSAPLTLPPMRTSSAANANGTASSDARRERQATRSPTTPGSLSSRSSRPLPNPPAPASPPTPKSNGFMPPPPPPQLPTSTGSSSPSSQEAGYFSLSSPTTSDRMARTSPSLSTASPSGYDSIMGNGSGARLAAHRALTGTSSHSTTPNASKRDFTIYGGQPQNGSGSYAVDLNGRSYTGGNSPPPPPPLPPKPNSQHSASYSVGGVDLSRGAGGGSIGSSHKSSFSVSVTSPSAMSSTEDGYSFASTRLNRDTSISGSSMTSLGPAASIISTNTNQKPPLMTSTTTSSRNGTWVSSPEASSTPTSTGSSGYTSSSSAGAPTALGTNNASWTAGHGTQRSSTSALPLPRDSLGSQSQSQYEFIDNDDFSLVESDDDDISDEFFNSSLLSHVAVKLRDKVPRETHVKGSVPYPGAFTGKDIVSAIQSIIQRDLPDIATDGRQTALAIARSLQKQLFFNEVEWEFKDLTDGVEDVYTFLDDPTLSSSSSPEGGLWGDREELPNGIMTNLTKCYVSTCGESEGPCYAWSCPRKVRPPGHAAGHQSAARRRAVLHDEQDDVNERTWLNTVEAPLLQGVSKKEINRQTVIFKTISSESKYLKDLDLIDSLFVKPLRTAKPPILDPSELDSFIECVFGNILDLRETNRRMLDKLQVRQREEWPFVQYIGDIFLAAATEFRVVYPKYVGNLVRAGQRVKDELDGNARFRAFHDECSQLPEARGMDLRQLITRPSEHLQKYPTLLDAIRAETKEDNPDAEYLLEASEAIRKLSTMAQLRAFQVSMLKGPAGDQEWHTLVAPDVRDRLPKGEVKRQLAIFELIKSEMEYVRDLEGIQSLFVRPLRAARLPLADPTERGMDEFLRDIFHNYQEILEHQRRLLNAFFEIQSEEYPCVESICAPIFDAALNWADAYMEYTAHYPIAEYRVEEAMAMPEFRAVVEEAQRHPDARKLGIKSFINRPISRILRYDLLLKRILDATPEDHEDRKNIPTVLPIVRDLNKAMDHAIIAPKRKVEMWRYHRNLVWRPGEEMNLDLLDETRQLIHTGRLLRQPESGFELGGWTELFILLFDNYLVMTKAKEKDGVVKYHVNRRPIPLELLTVLSFNDAPIQRSTSLLSGLRGGSSRVTAASSADLPYNREPAEAVDHRLVYPCSVYHSGRVGGHYQLFAESDKVRTEWKQKLDEATGLRKVVLENNKAFEVTTLSRDNFIYPSIQTAAAPQTWHEGAFTGRVTCSVPLKAANGRELVAVGCSEGVWIGLRHDSASLRRVLHLKNVTQCAMLEDFGIFLVLADKYLFAYHIEALVPTQNQGATTTSPREPQRLNRNRDVQFFSVGSLNDRTLIIYMKKKGLDSVFRVLEPVTEKIAEKTKQSNFSRGLFGTQKSEWFREYKEFFLPSEAYDLIFLKLKVAILCAKGFEIMDLVEFNSVTIPQRDDPRHLAIAKRCDSRRPMGMFRSAENEFLLCYDEFGLYVDRHGDLTNRQVAVVEWEGTAERVAFHPPYVVIFDSRFIEIRHIALGKLVQIIQGTDVHCTWDGRGYLSRQQSSMLPGTPGPAGWDENASAGEARIHAVMKAESLPAGAARGTVSQHVFALTPTQVLYPPASQIPPPPTSAGYFQTANSVALSPARSPRPSSVATGWSR